MKTDAEQRFSELMKEVIENTDFEDDLDNRLKEFGYDKPPDFETLQKRAMLQKRERNKARRSRFRKVAGFVIAVFIVSSAMNILENSNAVLASRFEINNAIFQLRHGFLITDFQFNSTVMGRELIIEKEEQIPIGRNFVGELKIPGYIPYGYNFVALHITNNPRNEYSARFIYASDEDNILMIWQSKLSPHNVVQQIMVAEKDFFVGDARVLYTPCIVSGVRSLFVATSTDMTQISGMFELDELVRIFEQLE